MAVIPRDDGQMPPPRAPSPGLPPVDPENTPIWQTAAAVELADLTVLATNKSEKPSAARRRAKPRTLAKKPSDVLDADH